MKRLSVFVITMLLGASLAFAQDAGDKTGGSGKNAPAADTGKKGHKGGKKAHKGGKKSKKGSSTDTATTPPK